MYNALFSLNRNGVRIFRTILVPEKDAVVNLEFSGPCTFGVHNQESRATMTHPLMRIVPLYLTYTRVFITFRSIFSIAHYMYAACFSKIAC